MADPWGRHTGQIKYGRHQIIGLSSKSFQWLFIMFIRKMNISHGVFGVRESDFDLILVLGGQGHPQGHQERPFQVHKLLFICFSFCII